METPFVFQGASLGATLGRKKANMSQNQRISFEKASGIASTLRARILQDCSLSYGKDFRICGSIRRNASDCGDIDIAVTREAFDANEMVFRNLLDSYQDTAKGRLCQGQFQDMKVEFYVGPAAGLGALVLFATGSPAFNVRCRLAAKGRGLALNQYGLFAGDTKSGNMVCDCTTELNILKELELEKFLDPLTRSIDGYYAH